MIREINLLFDLTQSFPYDVNALLFFNTGERLVSTGDNATNSASISQLEKAFFEMQTELTRLRNRTDLQAVQDKLDSFMDEVRLIHRGLLVALREMIAGLNAEGVKRYEGAVKAVNDNTTKQVQEIIKRLDKISMIV